MERKTRAAARARQLSAGRGTPPRRQEEALQTQQQGNMPDAAWHDCAEGKKGTRADAVPNAAPQSPAAVCAAFPKHWAVCAFTLLMAFALAVATALPRWAQAGSEPAQPVTITIEVEGYTGTLPTLKSGTDFTLGKPVGANPAFMADASGKQPLATLVESKEALGLTLQWHDSSGKEFDWLTTPVTESTTVRGTFAEADYEVRVSFNDEKTPDVAVSVPRGNSFKQAYGSEPAAPTKQGWEFMRWVDTSDNSTFDFAKPVTKSTSVYALFKVADTAKVEPFDPAKDIPKTLTGRCYIGATWSVHPAQFAVSGFTGGLEGYAGTGQCSLPSAAAPSNTWADYVATLKEVNVEAGEVVYDVNITPPDAASPDGPRNSLGLIGYQTVYLKAVIKKNFGGYVQVRKTSSNPSISEGNRNYSLQGAVFGVYNQEGSRVAELATAADGTTAQSPLLPAGTYTVREEKAPAGFAVAPDASATVTSGNTTTVGVADAPQNALVSLIGQKLDAETETPNPLGAATLEGALFRVSYYDQGASAPQALSGLLGQLGASPTEQEAAAQALDGLGQAKRTWTFKTDAAGKIAFDEAHFVEGDEFYRDVNGAVALPLGTVAVEEVQPPTGYLQNSTPWVVSLSAEGTEEHIEAWKSLGLTEQIIRGDLAFTKAKSGTMEHLANVPFRITSRTTGEEHTLVTDENGMASTASSWVPHSRNTNAGGTAKDGIWFACNTQGETAEVNDALGALPYDTYDVEELPCDANEDTVLARFTVTISRNSTTLDLGTIDNDAVQLEISGEVDKRETLMNEDGTFDYTIDYRSTSNTWVDEFTMADTITCAERGQAQLVGIATPVSFEDYDGLMNVWYRTNISAEEAKQQKEDAATDTADNAINAANGETAAGEAVTARTPSKTADESEATEASNTASNAAASTSQTSGPNASATNPFNAKNPTNQRIHDFSGWRIWKEGVSTLEQQELSAESLNLAQGEYVTGIAFEHGRVEEGFGTNAADAPDWQRPERYTETDVAELPLSRADFNLAQATGPTHTEEDKGITYAPALLHMQATAETLAGSKQELWNTAEIDTHRNLELHDKDHDSVVQSTDTATTAAEAVTAKLPKTNDVANLAPLLTTLALGTSAGLVLLPRVQRRKDLKEAILGNL